MYVKIKDFNIYYEKIGTGKKEILILPGWGDTRITFNYLIYLLKNEYTIYILDYPGFGMSEFPYRDLTVYDYADLIKEFMKKKKVKNPIVISHSFGSRIALILNGKLNISFEKLIIIDGAGIKRKKSFYLLCKQTLYKALKKLNKCLPKKLRKKYLDKLVKVFGSTDFKALSENMRRTFSNIVNTDLSYLLDNISSSTLLIWGEKDIDTPLKDGIKMNKKIKDSGLVIIKNASHYSYLDNKLYTGTIIREFLKEKT